MNINRNNYEEFFILYMDNELSSEDRRRVEIFAQENTDLKEELEILLQSRMIVDDTIVFYDKDSLLRFADDTSVNLTNYEQWFVLYTDNELTPAQKEAVETFAATQPSLQKEFNLLQQTRLQPESIIFPYKESLYRKEEKVRAIGIRWWQIAVAAALLLAVSTTAFFALNKKETVTPAIANGTDKKQKITQPESTTEKEQLLKAPLQEKENLVADIPKENSTPVIIENNSTNTTIAVAEKKNTTNKKQEAPVQTLPVKQEEAIANNNDKKPDNNLPKPTFNPNVINEKSENAIVKVEPTVNEALTNSKEIITPSNVTLKNTDALYTGNISTPTDDEDVDTNQPRKKNKLRGFFRKVTRTFEKTTNIKATDDEDRLLIGGLAIRL